MPSILDALRQRAALRAKLDPSFSKEQIAESAALTRQTCLNPAMWHELPFDIDEITVCLRAACAEATSDQCVAFSAQLADVLDTQPACIDALAGVKSATMLGRMAAGMMSGKHLAHHFLNFHSPGERLLPDIRALEMERGCAEAYDEDDDLSCVGQEWRRFLEGAESGDNFAEVAREAETEASPSLLSPLPSSCSPSQFLMT